MSVRVGINGFGRVGRTFLRVATASFPSIEIVAVNDHQGTSDSHAYSLRRDSLRGSFAGDVATEGSRLLVNGRPIQLLQIQEASQIPWGGHGVDVVIEATGTYRSGDAARPHVNAAGARKVILSAYAADPDVVLLRGINDHIYDPARHHVISPGPCGVNAAAMPARVLRDEFGGISNVSFTVLLAAQSWQPIQDAVAKAGADLRLRRSGPQNIIPYLYPLGHRLQQAMPDIGPVRQSFLLAPVSLGSIVTLNVTTGELAAAEEVNAAMAAAATGPLRRLLDYSDDPLVSSDTIGSSASCVFEPAATIVTQDHGVTVVGGFDNEWGFANRMAELAETVGQA